MKTSEVERMLVRHFRHDFVITVIAWIVSVVFAVLALMVRADTPWVITALLAVAILWHWLGSLTRKGKLVYKISGRPELVYWAHPSSGNRTFSGDAIDDCNSLLLHLRDGTKFRVDLPVEQMRAFIAWLAERNPSVRLGVYDNIDSTTSSDTPHK